MTTQTPTIDRELTAAEAAGGLHARMATLTAQLANGEDASLRRELIGLSAAARILTDLSVGCFDSCTTDDVIDILTKSPAIESFTATWELVAWLGEYSDLEELGIGVGDDALALTIWKCDAARAKAAEGLLAFSKGDLEFAEERIYEAVDLMVAFMQSSAEAISR